LEWSFKIFSDIVIEYLQCLSLKIKTLYFAHKN
jgi:hypothetical protein